MGNPWASPDDSQAPGQPEPRTPGPVPPPTGSPTRDGAQVPIPDGAPTSPSDGPDRPPSAAWQPGPRPVPPPDPVGVARASRTAAWTAAALLASVLLVSAPWPAMLAAPAAALAGFVLAIVAVVRASRARARGSVVALPVVLLVASLIWVGLSAQTLLYVDASRSFAQCESAALTQQAQRTCATQLESDMRDRLRTVFERLGVPAPPASR